MSDKTRPPLLSLLAALAGVVGVVTLLLALMRLGGGGEAGTPWVDSLLALLLGSFLVVASVGLFLGKPWGRMSGSGAFGLAALLQLWEILRPALRDAQVSTVTLSLRALALALLVSVLVYLNIRPAIDWFAPKDPTGGAGGEH